MVFAGAVEQFCQVRDSHSNQGTRKQLASDEEISGRQLRVRRTTAEPLAFDALCRLRDNPGQSPLRTSSKY